MDKKATAAVLGCSVRQVENFASAGRLGEVRYIRGRTGRQADYSAEAVEALRLKLEAERAEVIGDAIAPARGNSSALAVRREQLPDLLAAIAAAVRPAPALLPQAPRLWLTLAEAAEWTGLPLRHLQRALRADRERGEARRLRVIGAGRGLRVSAADLAREYGQSETAGDASASVRALLS